MLLAHRVRYSFQDYLTVEAESPVRHEFLDGQIYAMAGGTPEHGALAATLLGLLFGQLAGGRCRTLTSDVRIRVLATGLATYPDISIVYGPRQLDPDDKNGVTNPTVLVEVTSKSTEDYDRGEKFDEHYALIPSLEAYVIVAHDARTVEVRRRTATGWVTERAGSGDTVDLAAIGCMVAVDELYDRAAEPGA